MTAKEDEEKAITSETGNDAKKRKGKEKGLPD